MNTTATFQTYSNFDDLAVEAVEHHNDITSINRRVCTIMPKTYTTLYEHKHTISTLPEKKYELTIQQTKHVKS